MEYCRLQIGCLAIVLYIGFGYIRECKMYQKKLNSSMFAVLLCLSIICIICDGITAVTVNHLDTIHLGLNRFLHMLFLISIEAVVYMMFGYMLKTTGTLPVKRWQRILLHIPYLVNIAIVVAYIGYLDFKQGEFTNYSMGISANTCFSVIAIYIILTLFVFFHRWNYLTANKRVSILTYLLVVGGITAIQAVFPEVLLSSVAVTIMVVGIYMNQEDPVLNEISRYHDEMVMSFATLVENKDDSTGGHIKRTTAYVKFIAEELRQRGYYKEILTSDYIQNLCQAAPMHDIGKIAVSNAILQKKGKLTEEEYECMKLHALKGGEIIKETFGNLGNAAYTDMAYQVSTYHHEKWNGNGYPEGLKEDEIPLCARIMAVADVFDAVSEKRCYRDAMPLEKCFSIIHEGSGRDFEPIIADVFLECREKVEKIHTSINETVLI